MINPYEPKIGTIEKVIKETPNINTFSLKLEEPFEFKGGQFLQLTMPGVGEAPFTPSSSPMNKENLEVTIMDVGRVTHALHKCKEGDMIGIRGPFGKGYPLNELKGKEVLIVGGGVGGAPLRSLFLSLIHEISFYKKIVYCYGAKTPEDIVYKSSILDQWQRINKDKIFFYLTVEEGDDKWKGRIGLVTTTLDNLPINMKNSIAVVCGPPLMMKFTTLGLLEI